MMLAKPRGMTLLEVMIALSILSVSMMGVIAAISHAMLLSDTNRQLKMAIFDTQSVMDQVAGTPYTEICNTANNPGVGPRFPQGKYYLDTYNGKPVVRFLPIDSADHRAQRLALPTDYAAGAPYFCKQINQFVRLHLATTEPETAEKILVFYFPDANSQLTFRTIPDKNIDPDRADYVDLATKPWLSLSSGSVNLANPPDPLYVTVRCVWKGPEGQDMQFEVPFTVTNLIDPGTQFLYEDTVN
jgi:prepilin-type N-terminal cleavage/methylation domain-containing protein